MLTTNSHIDTLTAVCMDFASHGMLEGTIFEDVLQELSEPHFTLHSVSNSDDPPPIQLLPTSTADNELEDDDDGVDDSCVIESHVKLSKLLVSAYFMPHIYTILITNSETYLPRSSWQAQPYTVDSRICTWSIASRINSMWYSWPPSLLWKNYHSHLLLPPSMLLATSLVLVVWSTNTFMLLVVGRAALVVITHCSSVLLYTRIETHHLHMGFLVLKLPEHIYFSHLP